MPVGCQGKRIRKISQKLPVYLALADAFLDSRFPDCVIIEHQPAPPFFLRGLLACRRGVGYQE